MILLPSTSLDEAFSLAELLRERTIKVSFSVVGTKTISLGVATFHTGDDATSMVTVQMKHSIELKKMAEIVLKLKYTLVICLYKNCFTCKDLDGILE